VRSAKAIATRRAETATGVTSPSPFAQQRSTSEDVWLLERVRDDELDEIVRERATWALARIDVPR